MHTESESFRFFFVFVILTYENACYGCENAENRTWSEFFYDGQKFRRQCVNVIDTTWGRIYFSTCENFGLGVQWPLVQIAVFFNDMLFTLSANSYIFYLHYVKRARISAIYIIYCKQWQLSAPQYCSTL